MVGFKSAHVGQHNRVALRKADEHICKMNYIQEVRLLHNISNCGPWGVLYVRWPPNGGYLLTSGSCISYTLVLGPLLSLAGGLFYFNKFEEINLGPYGPFLVYAGRNHGGMLELVPSGIRRR